MLAPIPPPGDLSQLPLWSLCSFRRDYRTKANFEVASGAMLDVDGTADFDEDYLRARLGSFHFLAHTTKSHTPATPSFRVVIPFAQPLRGYEAFRRVVRRLAVLAGLTVDHVSERAAQPYYVPVDGPHYEGLVHHGRTFLDPQGLVLTDEPPVRAARVATASSSRASRPSSSSRGQAPLAHLSAREIATTVNYVEGIDGLSQTMIVRLGVFVLRMLERFKGAERAGHTKPTMPARFWERSAGNRPRQAAELRRLSRLWIDGQYRTRAQHGKHAHSREYVCLFPFDHDSPAPRRRLWWTRPPGARGPDTLDQQRRAWLAATRIAENRAADRGGIPRERAAIPEHIEGVGRGVRVEGTGDEDHVLLARYRQTLAEEWEGLGWSDGVAMKCAYVSAMAVESGSSAMLKRLLAPPAGLGNARDTATK